MGVTGLWKLIESSGKPVPVETLENKVLAIDISIWLHQVVKGFQDNKGGNLPNAHLLGLFHRLCKLMYFRVKPVFVFDGGVPQLKRETIAKRSQNRQKLYSEADRIQDLILQNLVRDQVVQKALGQEVCTALISPSKSKPDQSKPEKDDMFKLPVLPDDKNPKDEPNTSSSFYSDSASDADSSFEEKNLRYSYDINLQAIDVTSKHFTNLPADVRHDILTDIKETRKQSSWGRLHELPPAANDFSGFQMKRLLKRRQVQVSLEEAEKQMEGKSLTLTELETLMSEEGILKASESNAAKRIASNENTRFLLVKDLKKAVERAKKEENNPVKKEEIKKEDEDEKETNDPKEDGDERERNDPLGCEYEVDLQKAIEMSLETTQVYNEADYADDAQVKLNEAQRQQLKSTTNSLARTYMLEYGGMNDDDIKNMICEDEEQEGQMGDLQSSFSFQHNDRFILKGEVCTPYKTIPTINKTASSLKESEKAEEEIQYISSSSDDSDLEEVDISLPPPKKALEIIVDPTKATTNECDDLFADIFKNEDSVPFESEENKPTEDRAKKQLQEESEKYTNAEKSTIVESEKGKEASGSATDILQKLKKEMEKVSTITLDTIGGTTNNSLEKLTPVAIDSSDSEDITPKERRTVNSDELGKKDKGIVGNPLSDFESIDEESVDRDFPQIHSDVTAIPSTSSKPASDLSGILKQVKEQTSQITSIRLDDIDVFEKTVVSVDLDDSDDELVDTRQKSSTPPNSAHEIIEIPDDDIPGLKTPSKRSDAQSSLDNFIETKFIIKRTPEKEQSPPPSKMTSPFFVNRKSGSGSGRKRGSPTSDDSPSRNPKVPKQLFEDESIRKEADEDDIRPLEEPRPVVDVIEEAAMVLRENKSQSELADIAGNIRNENRALEAEKNKQNRMATSITDKMADDCKQLLRLFGVPYIVAPMEAEAQCAFLDAMNLTDGTVTDDSDIWLFGGCTVYKNFFNQKKHVLEFKMEDIEKLYNMNRHKLIQLAILVGSDYTIGVNGIGAVTAIEILANFPITPAKEGETTEIMSVLSSLRKFRDWWRISKTTVTNIARKALRSKLKNIDLNEAFPNMNIVNAYLHPTVDDNREKFTWGEPDIETIREFAKTKFGWTRIKTDEILQPVIKKLNERKTQASIKNYFAVKSVTTVRDLNVSKRVQKAIDRMAADYVESPTEPEPKERKTRKRGIKKASSSELLAPSNASASQTKKNAPPRKGTALDDIPEVEFDEDVADDAAVVPKKIVKKAPKIPNRNLPIPQREKDKQEMELKKKQAIEMFKKKKEASL